MRIAIVLVVATFMAGCANGFEKYYTPDPNAQAILKMPATLPPPKTPQVFAHSNDVNADAKRMAEDGYVYIGSSSFYGPANRSNQSQAIAQGEKVGAAVVLFKTDYMDTQSGVVPYTVANPPVVSTINTSGTVNTYGSGGYGSGSYNSTGTITTSGGYSTYAIPYTVNRNTFFASYWAKQDTNKMRLGVRYAPLTDELRLRLERNTGVLVQIVVRGTPAFSANFLEGDVLLKIGGADIVDVPGFAAQVNQFAGHTVVIDLLRAGQPRSITVALNQ
ncbi:MAG: PDZ domain-containing protein [Steroidobacterales bacterium]